MIKEESQYANKSRVDLEKKISTLRERARVSGEKANTAFEDQVRHLEDQYRLFQAEFDRKENQVKDAYSDFSDSAKKAWDDLWVGVEKASKNIH